MNKVLVLGSEGQIGQYLCERANASGLEVIRSDLTLGHDLRKASRIVFDQILESDLVYFLAFDVGGSTYLQKHQHSGQYLDDNISLMHNVFTMLDQTSVPFVFASSQMSNMGNSPYGVLKRLGEFYTNALFGINVRFWNVYGLERVFEKHHVITDCILGAWQRGQICLRTDGTESRQFLYGPDAAEALLNIGHRYENLDRGLDIYYDITSFEWTTIREVADLIASQFADSEVIASDRKDTTQTVHNEPTSRIRDFWQPTTTLEDGIKAVIYQMQGT